MTKTRAQQTWDHINKNAKPSAGKTISAPIDYVPTDVDTDWAKAMVHIIRDGGVWGWPDAQLIYKFDQANKVVTLMNPENLETAEKAHATHNRTKAVFAAIGWTVTP